MSNVCLELHEAMIAAGCPITGVSMGKMEDRNTWMVQWKGKPTSEQAAAAQRLLDTFDAMSPREDAPTLDIAFADIVQLFLDSGVVQADQLPPSVQAYLAVLKKASADRR